MLDTAPAAGDVTTAPASSTETRPVRMLVRTQRDNAMYLPEPDTLRAHDLGISRNTTDDELLTILEDLGDAHDTVFPGIAADAVLAEMTWLRDCLAQPRDIAEAREWGFIIPINELENWQEEDPRQELGWWWVYDPDRRETRDQRRARYMRDRRLVDTKGLARILCRAYPSIKSLKSVTEAARMSLENPEQLHGLAETFIEQNPDLTIEEATAILRADAEKVVSKGTPRIAFSYPKVDLYYASDAFRNGNATTRLNSWYEFNKLHQTGRPPGSRTTKPRHGTRV